MLDRAWFRAACVSVSVALCVSGLQLIASPVSAEESSGTSTSTGSGTDLVRPDSVSAMVTARASGHRVEDLSRRTETGQVFANPDGTWTAEVAPSPVRVKDPSGEWHDIDTTLIAGEGGLVPRYAASDLRLSGGGDRVFARITEDGKDLAWSWPTVLPTPTVQGDTATYADAVEGGDLVVTATPTGFSHSIVLRERPTDPDAAQLAVPVETDGAHLSETTSGGLQVKETAADGGDVVASAPQPLMWDSSKESNGDPGNVAPVDATVTQPGGITPEGAKAGADPVLTLTPDQAFLADPDTEYPVTIDPAFTVYPTGEVWLYNKDYTSGQTTYDEMRVGTWDGGDHMARSFLHFDSGLFANKDVSNATLRLRQFTAGSCTASQIQVARIIGSWSASTITWANQPAVDTTSQGLSSVRKGPAGCPAGDVDFNVTYAAQAWAKGWVNEGLRLRAAGEASDNNSWSKYRGVRYVTANLRPRLVVTYNQAPYVPAVPTMSPVASYAPPGSSTSNLYVASTKPTFTTSVSDPDGGSVRGYFEAATTSGGTPVSSCYSTAPGVASGSKASCALGTALTDGTTYYVRSTALDGRLYSGGSITNRTPHFTASVKFIVAAVKPAAPVVSCPAPYANNSWTTTAPGGSVTCTITATGTGASAPGYISYSADGGTWQRVKIAQSSDPNVAKTTVSIPATQGGHGIIAKAEGPSGLISDPVEYGFGYGNVGMTLPAAGNPETTTDTVAIEAAGPPLGDGTPTATASVKWRVAGTNADYATGWNEDTNAGLTVTNSPGGVHVTGAWDTRHAVTDTSSGTSPITLDPDRPVLLDVQVCIDYPGTQIPGHCSWAADQGAGARQVLRVAHAFGGNFPTADVPGGQVALWTGELALGDSDATVGAPGADLSVSRTAASFAGPPANPANQVFGPGWAASLDGPDAGLGDMTLIDNTTLDGTLQLLDGVGDVMLFGKTSAPTRRTGTDATIATGAWVALDEDTELSGTKLNVSGSGTATKVAVTEDDGTVTTYLPKTAPAAGTAGVFTIDSIDEAGTEGATTYSHDGQGRITRMVAPAPAGVTCPATGTLPAGCRAMTITYATSTTATSGTPGDVAGQVSAIQQVIGGTGPNGTEAVTTLATYQYDDAHRLVSATDPRNNLTTSYTYDGTSDRVASMTPAGLKPINYLYASGSHKLARVTRERPATDAAGGTANLATIVYDVPTHGHTGLPDLDQAAVDVWAQKQAPSYGAAVFGPDQPFSSAGTSVSVADVDAAGAGGGEVWKDADLTYTDADGREVNTAEYGAGTGTEGWQFTATEYDTRDNPIRALEDRDIAAIKAGDLPASQAGTLTVYNDDQTGLPAGSAVTDSYGPARWIRDTTGAWTWARPHTHTDYDQGAPNGGINPATGQRYALRTTVTAEAINPDTNQVVDTYTVTKTGYDNAVPGDTQAGWNRGLAATVITDMTGSAGSSTSNIVSETRYDATGRVVETRQPNSNGTDAGTRKTLYYTAGANADAIVCGNKPAWAGAMCRTTYAAQTSGVDLVTTTVTAYDDQLNALTTQETANGATRTITRTYRADGTSLTSTVTATGLAGSTPIGKTTIGYDAGTGLATSSTIDAAGGNPGGTISTGYDTWGRQTTYTVVDGVAATDTTTTSYNADGDVASVTDPQGTTNYTYDGTDAAGNSEHRGLVTKIAISRPTGGNVEVAGAYNAAGDLVIQKLPGGITQRAEYDTAGEPTDLSYSGTVSTYDPDSGVITGTTPDSAWVGWSQDNDALGRVRREWTPSGAAFTGDTTGAAATGYSRDYTYDRAARLVRVKDQTVPTGSAGAGTASPDDPAGTQAITACQIRDYAFDANGNRTSRTATTGAVGAACPTPGGAGAITKTWTYDSGDRLTTAPGGGSYVYDAFGRATTLPADDTPTGTSAASMSYYDNNAVKSMTQNGASTAFNLDSADRRSTSVTTSATGASTTTVRHYSDGSDNPSWTSTVTGTGSPVIERYAETLGGTLGLTLTGTSVSLSMVDLHGDNVAQVDVPASGDAAGLASWNDTDEYGSQLIAANVGKTPTNTGGAGDGLGYGWLGGQQRAADQSGLMLMGARVYNPVSGAFTSTDPIFGGNATTYGYPGDPVNKNDSSGMTGGYDLKHLYDACRHAGGGRGTCRGAVRLSIRAWKYANRYGNTRWVNAMRHFIWQAALTAKYGFAIAMAMGDRLEKGDNSTDSKVDLLNNSMGRLWGWSDAKNIRNDLNFRDNPYPWDGLYTAFLSFYENHLLAIDGGGGRIVPSCMKKRSGQCVGEI